MSSNSNNIPNTGSEEDRKSWYYKTYESQYDNWVPWMEEKYLAWFGENKTSYLAKENISSRGQVNTGVEPVNKVQDGVSEAVGGQFSQGGLLGGVGQATSKEGVDRAERGDTDVDPNAGQSYLGQAGSTLNSYNPFGGKK